MFLEVFDRHTSVRSKMCAKWAQPSVLSKDIRDKMLRCDRLKCLAIIKKR